MAAGWIWLAPAVWVATEYGRLAIFGGFPWVLLGYSQVTVLPIAQLASVTGVFGLSALLAASATAVAWPVVSAGPRRWVAPAVVAGLVAGAAFWGQQRIAGSDLTAAGQALRVGIVQGNVDQGIEVGSGAGRRDLRAVPAAHRSRWPIRARGWSCGPSRRRRSTSSTAPSRRSAGAGAAARRAVADRQRPVGAGDAAAHLQRGVSRQRGRHDRRRVPEGAPGAVWRVRPAQGAAVFRQAAGRGGVGLRARHRSQHPAGRRAGVFRPRFATRSSTPGSSARACRTAARC